MSFAFRLAEAGDDEDIRSLLSQSAMPGDLTVAFEREPDYFLGCEPMGSPHQTVLARDRDTGELAGIVYRGIATRYVNGACERVGYIGLARVSPTYQGTRLPVRVIPVLRALDERQPVDRYITIIADRNRAARTIFAEHSRPIFPPLIAAGGLVTLGIVLRAGFRRRVDCPGIRSAEPNDLPQIIALLNSAGREKQFFPCYGRDDLAGSPRTRDLSIGDFLVAVDGRVVNAVMGLWDQQRYKQTRVVSYHGPLAIIRPVYNFVGRMAGLPPLPAPGTFLESVTGACVAVRDNSPDLFAPLLAAACRRAAGRGFSHLLVQFSERDPLLEAARRFFHVPYTSTVYTFTFKGGEPPPLDGRVPYVEMATI